MGRKSQKQYIKAARKLKNEKLIKSIPDKFTPAEKSRITRLYNKYAEILDAPPREFKRVYTSEAKAAGLAENGYLKKGRFAWVPLKGAKTAKMQGGKDGALIRQYSDKIEFEFIGSEFKNIIGSDAARKTYEKKIEELREQYKRLGLCVFITGQFEGASNWNQNFTDLKSLLNYINRFAPHDVKSLSKNRQRKYREDLLKTLGFVVYVEKC